MIRKIKKGFRKVHIVDINDNKGHIVSVEFPTETGALIYEKLIEIEGKLGNKKEVPKKKPLTEEEKKLLEDLKNRA